MKKLKTTNPEAIELIRFLRRQSRENDAPIWRDIAERLAKPKRKRIALNVSCLSRYTEKNQTVVVPGKVLGTGEIDHPITITAFALSRKAEDKIIAASGKLLSFADLVKRNPKGSHVRIVG